MDEDISKIKEDRMFFEEKYLQGLERIRSLEVEINWMRGEIKGLETAIRMMCGD